SFAVDTSRITLWGQGTGGYLSLAAASLDRYIEIVTTTNPAGKFLTDLDGDPSTLEPMVIEAINGDIFGTTEAGVVDPNSGAIVDVLCRANYVGYSSDFQLCVNLGGALGDISWVEAGDVPMISYHAPKDPFAPYDDATLIVPTTGDPIVQVQGSFAVLEKANDLGNNQVFVDANFNDPFTQAAKDASTKAGHDYLEGLYPFNIPTNQFNQEEGSPWDYWDEGIWSAIEHPSCMGAPVSQCNFHTISLLSNAMMSDTRAKTYIDTIIGYFAPRAFEVLDLGDGSSTEELLDNGAVKLNISPNPARELVRFATEEALIRSISIYDVNGRLVSEVASVDATQYFWYRNSLPTGMYVAKLKFDEGVISHKLMLE
ncbi:MAG: T9SS type A sorting domain-containing protein, partial [Bacteroidota bacterium]